MTAVLSGCGGGGEADLGTVKTDAGTYRIVTSGATIEQALLFAVPTSAAGFTLRVKGNPPVDLGL